MDIDVGFIARNNTFIRNYSPYNVLYFQHTLTTTITDVCIDCVFIENSDATDVNSNSNKIEYASIGGLPNTATAYSIDTIDSVALNLTAIAMTTTIASFASSTSAQLAISPLEQSYIHVAFFDDFYQLSLHLDRFVVCWSLTVAPIDEYIAIGGV